MKKIIVGIFVAVCLVQLYVPAKMILDREVILETGKAYKFKMAPVDPYDAFRGKYISLSFEENQFVWNDTSQVLGTEALYVTIANDTTGYARIEDVSFTVPEAGNDYIQASAAYVTNINNRQTLQIAYPFDRYYMEETKAPVAETVYREALRDSTKTAYAIVRIKDGEAVLQDVMIDGVPIQELAGIPEKE